MRLSLYRGKWAAVWTAQGQVKRRSFGTTDRAAAEAAFDRFKREFTGQAATVAEAVATYCTRLVTERSGAAGAVWAAKCITRLLGEVGLDDITETSCRAYYVKRHEEGRSDGTIIKELSVLRAALNELKPNHGSKFWFPAAPPPRDKRLTREQFEQLLAGASSPHLRLFLELAASTGARMGALLELTWGQIDFHHSFIDLRGARNSNKRRSIVPMTSQVRLELMTLHAADRPSDEQHVITYNGEPIKSPKRAFRRAVERSGLVGVTPHVIRHSVACWMAEGGVPMPEIAAFLGHTDSRITERVYAKYSPGYLRKAVSVLNREFPPVQSEQAPAPQAPSSPLTAHYLDTILPIYRN